MAPSTLQGLNIVHAPAPAAFPGDADLLAGAHYPPELAAQLDLWAHLAFQTDEAGPAARAADKRAREDEDEEDEAPAGPAQPDGHDNVVTTTAAAPAAPGQQPDLASFLAQLGMPYQVSLAADPASAGPSLASILSLYQNATSPTPAASASPPTPAPASGRAAKKARTSKTSAAPSPLEDDDEDGLLAGLTPAEDKRRRNTAASARFRAKKKEREQALDARAKELDGRVQSLERECEALRRENGWLRGLVVGATGAAGAPLIPGLALPPKP